MEKSSRISSFHIIIDPSTKVVNAAKTKWCNL